MSDQYPADFSVIFNALFEKYLGYKERDEIDGDLFYERRDIIDSVQEALYEIEYGKKA